MTPAIIVAATLAWQLDVAAAPAPADVAGYAESLLAHTYRADAPGVAVLVTRGDDVLFRGARGLADVAGRLPLDPGDRFRIASVTKQFAAAGLLTLVDAGKVALDDPLSNYLPDYPDGDRITIEQLLNHTSGVKDYTSIAGTFDGPIRRDLSTAQLIDYFRNAPPEFGPGTGWAYSNSGYVLVGAVIESASGMAWHDYLDETLFVPLGMQDTGYGADPAIVAKQVTGYVTIGAMASPASPISMTQPHAAGALVSTVDDLGRWNRALHRGRVLAPASYQRMITPTGKAKAFDYGFGIVTTAIRGTPALHHRGGIPGFSAHLIHVPAAAITVAVLHNSETPSEAQQPSSIARRLAAAALGNPYPPVTPIALDRAALRRYEGVYRVDGASTRTLRVVDGSLTAMRTGGVRDTLTPIGEDTFLYPDGFNRLQVLRDADGKPTSMRFWPEGEGEGLIAPITDQPVPIDFSLPADALSRVVSAYWPAVLLLGATSIAFAATRLRRKRAASRENASHRPLN